MSSVCDSYCSRDYHEDTGSRVVLSATRFVSILLWEELDELARSVPEIGLPIQSSRGLALSVFPRGFAVMSYFLESLVWRVSSTILMQPANVELT